MSKNLCDEYFDYYQKYISIYGEKTCILMQVGMFYEIQSIRNEKETIGNLIEVADVLHIQVTKKNKNIQSVDRNNPLFGGFPKHAFHKYLGILLNNGYTVVVVDQSEMSGSKTKRIISGIYSPSIYPIDFSSNETIDGHNLSSILVELYPQIKSKKSNSERITAGISFSNINLSTNTFDNYEYFITIENNKFETILDEIIKIGLRYNTQEYIFTINSQIEIPKQLQKDFIINYIDLWDVSVHYNTNIDENYGNIVYQNNFFKKIYTNNNFGLLDPIEYFDLSQYQLTVQNILIILSFISKHDEKYVSNISYPKIIKESDKLVLEMNTLKQLNVLSSKSGKREKFSSLFDVIDKTSTTIGKRGLKTLLCKPFTKKSEIVSRYELSEQIISNNLIIETERILEEICDFEKLHRRMSLGVLHPYEFYNLHTTYENIICLQKLLKNHKVNNLFLLDETVLIKLNLFIEEYCKLFKLEELRKYNLQETAQSIGNFFNSVPSIVEIEKQIACIEDLIEKSRLYYESLIPKTKESQSSIIKLGYTETEGYYFTTTNIRVKILQKNLKEDELKNMNFKTNNSICKITNDKLRKHSIDLINLRDLFAKKIRLYYTDSIIQFYNQYKDIFVFLRIFVETIDICKSNAKCKTIYKYCRPEIIDSDDSFIKAEQLRHPIIERLDTKTMYIPNDICLKKEKCGMILYALNSCGKSSLLRAIGLSLIMAQCGLYVPCKSFVFSPFTCIITQVDLYDNLWKAQSSFITEMIGLKKIMNVADNRCLVLSDELTKGTEVISATSIFAAAVLRLVNKNCKFVFTTHLQNVAKLEQIQKCDKIKISHLSVNIIDDNIIFERTLKDGPCSELYGLEVAKAVGLDKDIMDLSFDIRGKLIGKSDNILKMKKSRYNTKKLLHSCEVCNYTPTNIMDIPLDTHHIKFQCSADVNDFNDHYHKNSMFNLVCLCKQCHIDVHKGTIIINGYIQTTKGVVLDYKEVAA